MIMQCSENGIGCPESLTNTIKCAWMRGNLMKNACIFRLLFLKNCDYVGKCLIEMSIVHIVCNFPLFDGRVKGCRVSLSEFRFVVIRLICARYSVHLCYYLRKKARLGLAFYLEICGYVVKCWIAFQCIELVRKIPLSNTGTARYRSFRPRKSQSRRLTAFLCS